MVLYRMVLRSLCTLTYRIVEKAFCYCVQLRQVVFVSVDIEGGVCGVGTDCYLAIEVLK